MSGAHDDLFEQIAGRKPGSRRNRIAVGDHKLVLRTYKVDRTSLAKDLGIEATFVVLESSCYQPGSVVSYFWYLGAKDTFGFGQERAQEFIATVAQCIGDKRDLKTIGCDLHAPQQFGRGVAIAVKVSQPLDEFGKVKLSKKGKEFTEATWFAIPNDPAQIAATRRDLEAQDPSLNQPAQPQYHQAPAQGYPQQGYQTPPQYPNQQAPAQGYQTPPQYPNQQGQGYQTPPQYPNQQQYQPGYGQPGAPMVPPQGYAPPPVQGQGQPAPQGAPAQGGSLLPAGLVPGARR
jgi:hypothetical protein